MKTYHKKYLIPLITMTLITLLIYPFMVLRGEWGSLLMSIFPILGISHYLDKYTGKSYSIYSFSILIVALSATLFFVRSVRNNSKEIITINGEISEVNNSYNYVHFELKEYPDITFKSYDLRIRESFRNYTPEKYYQKIPVNLGKKTRLTIFKSHLEWYRKPYVRFWHSLRFPLEVELESFEIVE